MKKTRKRAVAKSLSKQHDINLKYLFDKKEKCCKLILNEGHYKDVCIVNDKVFVLRFNRQIRYLLGCVESFRSSAGYQTFYKKENDL